VHFDRFDVDAAAGELRRDGTKIRIQDLPFRVLVELLSRPGEVVSREDLKKKLWGAETFVDFEAGLNTAIAKLREALGDNAEQPKYIETVPKRGYRFVGKLDVPGPGSRVQSAKTLKVGRAAAIAAVLVLAVTALVAYKWQPTKPAPIKVAVVLFHNETGRPEFDAAAQRFTDATVFALATHKELAVIGNAAILRTPRIFSDLKKIAAELNVSYIVLGQVQTNDAGMLVRTHLIRTSDQAHVWVKPTKISNDAGETAVAEKDIAAAVAQAVMSTLGNRPPSSS
jgi:DNA-binding winged helix-turn-helix (wHTH) protein/TolB-like protein